MENLMKKTTLLVTCILALVLSGTGQNQSQADINSIRVPIRVFDGNNFVDNLTIEDLELFENGLKQKIEALYLADGTHISREEEYREFQPNTKRVFYLLFQLTEYNPRLADAFDYLFKEVLTPQDSLVLMTPRQNYSLSPDALASRPPEQLAEEMTDIVRKDIKVGSSEYRSLMRDLKRLVRSLSGTSHMGGVSDTSSIDANLGIEHLLSNYRDTLEKIETIRFVEEKTFLNFAAQVKQFQGQKNVFLFYQREYRPEIQARIMDQMLTMYQDRPNIIGDVQDLMQFYRRQIRLDTLTLQRAFSDASIFLNFIFMDKNIDNYSGIDMREQSEDVFKTFTQIANASGGVVDNSQNPYYAFQQGCEVAGHYYILYYTPTGSAGMDYNEIEVRVKNPDYRVTHRGGYYN
jgi:hypothetical protein